MRELKDSGVEWIGEIPREWEYYRIKYNYYLKGRIGWQGLKAEEFTDVGPYLITGTDFQNGKVNWESCYHITLERYEEAPEIHVKPDDLLITKDGTVGKVAFIDNIPDRTSLNSHLLLIRPITAKVSNRYLFWILQSPLFDFYNGLVQNGTIMASLSQEKISDFSFAIPNYPQQRRIADYLDAQCARIDRVIARQQEIIEKLKEYKLAVITEAVTKGLNPDVPMKDSGIEWIGEIPEGWEIRKIRWDFSVDLGKMLDAKRISGDHLGSYLRNTDVQWGQINFVDLPQMDFYEDETDRYQVSLGDLLVCEGGEIGRCAIVPSNYPIPTFYQKALHRVRARKIGKGNVEYLYFVLYSMSKNQYFFDSPEKSTIAHLPAEILNSLRIAAPPEEEQMEIAKFLDLKCSAIDALIIKKQGSIDKLTEYKKSLIYEAVTGKREV